MAGFRVTTEALLLALQFFFWLTMLKLCLFCPKEA
jgi:hypothetical protein